MLIGIQIILVHVRGTKKMGYCMLGIDLYELNN